MWEKIGKHAEDLCWEEKEDLYSKNHSDGPQEVVARDARASLQCRPVLLPLHREHRIEEAGADTIEDARKNEEDAPEEDEALTEYAREEEGDN